MLNVDKLNAILAAYKRDFSEWWKHDAFKWIAVKHFQKNWDIDATDFGTMFKNATKKTKVLLTSGRMFPIALIAEFASLDNEATRQMFRNLFDESISPDVRIDSFIADSKKMNIKISGGKKNHFQTLNSVSTYLWLRYPDKYSIYKYDVYCNFASAVDPDFIPKGNGLAENVTLGYKLIDEIKPYIVNDQELISMFTEKLTDDCYPDTNFSTLTYDILFYYAAMKPNVTQIQHPSIWKISHGTQATGIPDDLKQQFLDMNIAVVHGKTKAKAATNEPQGDAFVNAIKKGDYFYLCFGNSIRLFGRFLSNDAQLNRQMDDDWYERKYETIAQSVDESKYTGEHKWWTPDDNSTCIKIPENEKGLFEQLILKPYFNRTLDNIGQKEPAVQSDEKNVSIPKLNNYSETDFLNTVFLELNQYYQLSGLIKNKKNVILQGAPGVGKTFAAKRLAYAMMGEIDDSRIQFVQFHQNYSYEDFIEGYRPAENGFTLENGIFKEFCKKAADDKARDYFFIIDEINRGNMSKIFGELMMLIEKEYRGQELTLAYSKERFSVPDNLYIIGMMNTADRSLAMIDYALRRRFSFFEMEPAFDSEGFKAYQKSLDNPQFDELIELTKQLNIEIENDSSLGKGFRIGHSYFCNLTKGDCTEERLRSIVQYDLIPLLSEYWFDNPTLLNKWETDLRGVVHDN